jgi:hypothetical protein
MSSIENSRRSEKVRRSRKVLIYCRLANTADVIANLRFATASIAVKSQVAIIVSSDD